MGDSTCVIQSFEHSPLQQGDTVVRALGESVSFGRFVTETLEWDKWSTFSQNRYLEEAQRYSKPGLVAQKKALFEAHFKKIAADRAAAAAKALLESEAVNSSSVGNENLCEPCVDLGSGLYNRRCSADAARNSSELNGTLILDQESQFGGGCCVEENDSTVYVSDFCSVDNCYSDDFVQRDESSCDMAVDTIQDFEQSDTSKYNRTMVVEEFSSFQKTELAELDQGEVVNKPCTLLDDPPKNIPFQLIQEPSDQSVLASTGTIKPTLTCKKTLASVRKPAVWSNSYIRPPAPPRKENNTTRNTTTVGSAMLNKKSVRTKSLHSSINFKSSHQDSKILGPTKLDRGTFVANSFSLRKSKGRPDQVSTEIVNRKMLATASNKLAAIRKSSDDIQLRPASLQIKPDETERQRDTATIRATLQMRKSIPKALHMSVNLDSHIGEKDRLLSLRRTGTKTDGNSTRMSTTYSAHTTARAKQIIPVLNSSSVGRKMIPRFQAKSTPPLHKNIIRSIQRNSDLSLSRMDINKSKPKSLHMSVDRSSTVGVVSNPAPAQKRGISNVNAPTSRASRDSKDCSSQGSLKKSFQTADILQLNDKGKHAKLRLENISNGMKDTEKCPPQKMSRPPTPTPTNLIRPPSPTVSTPFRFRSDERAANRKEKFEEKYKVETENSLQRKGKLPLSRPQSPMCSRSRKPSPSKVRETRSDKPPQSPAARKAGSHQVPGNKASTTSMALLPRKTACENASPNIDI